MLLDQHQHRHLVVVQVIVYHIKLQQLVQLASSPTLEQRGKFAIAALLATFVMEQLRQLPHLLLVNMPLEVQVLHLLAPLTISVLIPHKVPNPVLVAFNQQLELRNVLLLLQVILHLQRLAVLGITDEVEIQMVAQYAQSASSVHSLQMLTQLFVERAHIQV